MAYRFEPRKKVNSDVKMDFPEKRPDPEKLDIAIRRESSTWCLCGRCVTCHPKWNVFVAVNLTK